MKIPNNVLESVSKWLNSEGFGGAPNMFDIAMDEYGVTEISGSEHEPRIVEYSQKGGFKGIIDDETAWCSIFVNYIAKKCGMQRSKKANARSWLNVGVIRELDEAIRGDVVILWRVSKDSWKGHVGIYAGKSKDKKLIHILGGNQTNMVCIRKYPAYRLLGIRRMNTIN